MIETLQDQDKELDLININRHDIIDSITLNDGDSLQSSISFLYANPITRTFDPFKAFLCEFNIFMIFLNSICFIPNIL